MTPKEYAISLGLAKPGRGRLSREAHAAINNAIKAGTVFDDPKVIKNESNINIGIDKPVHKRTVVVAVEPQTSIARREQDIVWGIDKGLTAAHRDLVIAFASCAACSRPVRYCTHDVPQLPAFIGGGNAIMELV